MRNSLRILSVLLLCLPGCERHQPRQIGDKIVVSVKGDKISEREWFDALQVASGADVMAKLVEQKLILAEAMAQNITVSASERQTMRDEIDRLTIEPNIQRVLEQEGRARILFRKLLLKDISEAQKKKVYRLFRKELTLYQVYAIVLTTHERAELAHSALIAGQDFEKVVSEYSQASATRRGGSAGYLTLPVLRKHLGPEVAEVVATLKAGLPSEPLSIGGGRFVILKVGEVKSSYLELQQAVEDLFEASGGAALLNRLHKEAPVTYHTLPHPSRPPILDSPLLAAREPNFVAPRPAQVSDLIPRTEPPILPLPAPVSPLIPPRETAPQAEPKTGHFPLMADLKKLASLWLLLIVGTHAAINPAYLLMLGQWHSWLSKFL